MRHFNPQKRSLRGESILVSRACLCRRQGFPRFEALVMVSQTAGLVA